MRQHVARTRLDSDTMTPPVRAGIRRGRRWLGFIELRRRLSALRVISVADCDVRGIDAVRVAHDVRPMTVRAAWEGPFERSPQAHCNTEEMVTGGDRCSDRQRRDRVRLLRRHVEVGHQPVGGEVHHQVAPPDRGADTAAANGGDRAAVTTHATARHDFRAVVGHSDPRSRLLVTTDTSATSGS